jgi:hypothetical protein
MSKHITQQGVVFRGLSKTAVVARFDQEHASSDGGALLLKACDERMGRSAVLTACLLDDRQQAKVGHSYQEIFRQRIFGISCGYADGKDVARRPSLRASAQPVARDGDFHRRRAQSRWPWGILTNTGGSSFDPRRCGARYRAG